MMSTVDVNDPVPPPNTPPNTPPSSATMDASSLKKRVFWVSPPLLHLEEKREYKEPVPGTFSEPPTDDEDETPEKIVGEIRLGTELFYWVAYQDGVVHRPLAKEFRSSHNALVDAYTEQKEEGILEEFDIKSSRIHPKDRININIATSSRKPRFGLPGPGRIRRTNPPRATQKKVVDSEDEESDSQSEDDYEGADEGDFESNAKKSQPSTRRSTRNTSSRTKMDYRETSESPVQTRLNPKRQAKKKIDDDNYDEDIEESNTEDEQPKPKKKAARGRLSRPAYGNIRHVAELSDDDSDDDTAPLQAHRSTCEKCQEPPAHELLARYYKRGKRKAKPKKAKVDDDFGDEDEEAEEQRLLALGGWVRCLKCCLAAHWKCLAASQRDEIIKAARSKDKEAEVAGLPQRKRESLNAYDTTEFICGGCIKGGICMFCLQIAVEAEAPLEKMADVAMEPPAQREPKLADGPLPNKDMANHSPPPTIVVSIPTPREDGSNVLDTSTIENPQASRPLHDTIPPPEVSGGKIFRCITCKRLAHYPHLPQPNAGEVLIPVELARYYQTENNWDCPDCDSFVDPLDRILAWRPYPANAVEPPKPAGEPPNHKLRLPREYLVKWVERSYRRLAWVPHMWLLSTNVTKLKNFLATGPKVHLLDIPTEDLVGEGKDGLVVGDSTKEPPPMFLIAEENSRESSAQPASGKSEGPSPAFPDAERRIPLAWKTVDRVLEIRLWNPAGRKQHKKAKTHKGNRKSKRVRSDPDDNMELENEDIFDAEAELERVAAREQGKLPTAGFLETLDEWEERTGDSLAVEHAELVIWAFMKWDDLAYEEATWDSPPGPSDIGWTAFVQAFERFLESREVFVPLKNKSKAREFDTRPKALFEQKRLALKADPAVGQHEDLKLMDFQLTGLNWLFRNWWRRQPSILADEMGLGKTVQIAAFIGHLVQDYQAFPVLIVVPNSTITNWLREFARWAPRLRVVPFYGEAKSREIIREYELYHDSVRKDFTKLKFHVLVTTYETLLGKDFGSVFKPVHRWELLVVDEGQRLKNDSSLLFKKLNELNTIHRILMTGTPLNNNIRELFNLMNFLDPREWSDLASLEKRYETLTEDLLNELHEALKPYFLRRTKADVLKLPPKNEVIVPVSMTAIQKEVYKSILSQNMEILGMLAQPSSRVNSTVKKSNLNNILMQLRKCLQHPYLISRELEPTGPELTPSDVHHNLLEASAKLRLLHSMLPKLQVRGHRVLLFSQFTMALDIIEDFLAGEGYKFLRLDGTTKHAQRQKDMDTFNRTDSDIFIYLLSTRAGGVGINLWSADTVIIFDPDFNPHQDLQAISRAHRYGQTKTVLVFKLMVKGAAEERIVQAGKKKLALDHLIVQKMDDDGVTDDMQSILTFGAKAVFEGSDSNDIIYTDADLDNLITRTEKEGEDVPGATKSQLSFGFAKLWVVEKDSMEEIPDDAPADIDNDGFWGSVLARAAAEKAKAKAAEVTGRGAKRRAAVPQTYKYDDDGSPVKSNPKKRKSSSADSDVEYHVSEVDSGNEMRQSSPSTPDAALLSGDEMVAKAPSQANPPSTSASKPEKKRHRYKAALAAIENPNRRFDADVSDDESLCGLCHTTHGQGSCFMTQNPSNLVDYRRMLVTDSPEPKELRQKAMMAIDRNLAYRGLSHLVNGQPVGFSRQGDTVQPAPRKKKHRTPHINSLKRPRSPDASSSSKKAKQRRDVLCDICGGPFHLVRFCPIVNQGPESIMEAITRLEQDRHKTATVSMLRALRYNL